MRRFEQVDVFASEALRGNPVAVVVDGLDLSAAEMQRFAHWTNLSETTFLLPASNDAADYRVRIFTPSEELPFAGHPTLGSCHAWLGSGGSAQRDDVIVQECGVGLVEIRRDGGRLAFAAPPMIRSGPVEPAVMDQVIRSLKIQPSDVVDAAWVDNGPGWVGIELASADAVLALNPGPLEGPYVGIVGALPSGDPSGASFEVRAFFSVDGQTREDPVTGSLNASLAQWMIGRGRSTAPYTTRQGTALGRDGRIFIDQPVAGGPIWIGGHTVTVINGTITL